MGVHEVTRGEFARFVRATNRSMGNSLPDLEYGSEWVERSGHQLAQPRLLAERPASGGVRQLGRRAGVRALAVGKDRADRYRLLSESEWEYVARAGTRRVRFTRGRRYRRPVRRTERTPTTTYGGGRNEACTGSASVPVETFSPNGFGLHEVHGNVWEWTQDCWNDSYDGAPRDGRAWEQGNCSRRVLRGGSWYDVPRLPAGCHPQQVLHRVPQRLSWFPPCPDAYSLNLYIFTSVGPGGSAPWSKILAGRS